MTDHDCPGGKGRCPLPYVAVGAVIIFVTMSLVNAVRDNAARYSQNTIKKLGT